MRMWINFFSKVSHKLKKSNIETFQGLLVTSIIITTFGIVNNIILYHADLIKFTRESTSPEPTMVTLTSVHDVKSWISPFLDPFAGHSTPHCFKLVKDATGEVRMYYKCWSSDPWCTDEEVIIPLKVSNNVIKNAYVHPP
jgi:hypothetical protein